FAAHGRQVIRSAEFALGHSATVGSRTKYKAGVRRALLCPPEHGVGHVALRRSQRTPALDFPGVQSVRNVIEKQRKVLASQGQHLLETLSEVIQIGFVAVAQVQSRAERVNEAEVSQPAALDQLRKLLCLDLRIGFAP